MIKGTENIPVGDLISRRVPFVIPRYQRGYAWEKEEIADFIGDIQALYSIHLNHNKMKRHFFGGLVSVDQYVPNTVTGRAFEVVDGQQRLATFMITMALMIDSLKSVALQAEQANNPDIQNAAVAHAEQTRKDFLIYQEVEQGQLKDRLRLRLSKVDHDFFEKLLIGEIKPKPKKGQDSHRKLRYAYRTIRKQIFEPILEDKKLDVGEKLERLLLLRTCITDDCHVIFIVSDDKFEAYHLFTTLNDRGRNLSNGDLLRSTTLELLEGNQKQQERVEILWHNILAGRTSEVDKFLHSYYISFSGMRAPKKDLFDDFRKEFFNYEIPPPNQGVSNTEAIEIEQKICNMDKLSVVFKKIADGEWPYDSTPTISDWERDRLYRLIKVLQHTLCYPLLLTAYDKLTEADFNNLVLLLERFVFRYIIIAGVHESKLADVYYRYCTNIRANPTDYKIADLESDLRALARNDAPDSVFETNLITKLTYNGASSQKRRIKHFLTTLEDHHTWFLNGASGKPSPNKMSVWDLNQVTIEHIYPQKPKPEDIDLELEPHKHEIANLSFWASRENSAARNDPFPSKKFRYERSTVMMNQELADIPNWDLQALEKRTQELLKKAKKLFAM